MNHPSLFGLIPLFLSQLLVPAKTGWSIRENRSLQRPLPARSTGNWMSLLIGFNPCLGYDGDDGGGIVMVVTTMASLALIDLMDLMNITVLQLNTGWFTCCWTYQPVASFPTWHLPKYSFRCFVLYVFWKSLAPRYSLNSSTSDLTAETAFSRCWYDVIIAIYSQIATWSDCNMIWCDMICSAYYLLLMKTCRM